jgi:hypothetical protein
MSKLGEEIYNGTNIDNVELTKLKKWTCKLKSALEVI